MSSRINICAGLISILLTGSCASGLSTEPEDPAKQIREIPGPTAIIGSKSCFSGAFGSYDTWLAKLAKAKAKFDRATFERRISRERFDRAKEHLDCQRFLYSVDDVVVVGYSVRSMSQQASLPVVIYNRGGNAAHAKITLGSLFNHIIPLAEQGYFVIASQYRGSGFQRDGVNTGTDEFGGKDVDDVMALFDLIDHSPFTDKDRIGMFGWSRGAIMSFLAATRTDRLSAIVVGGAPTDIAAEVRVRPEMERVFEARIPNYLSDKSAALESRSVVYWADKLPKETPILVLHGRLDKNVTVGSALGLASELQKQGIPYRLVIYDDGSHSLLEHNEQVQQEIFDWFAEKLQ